MSEILSKIPIPTLESIKKLLQPDWRKTLLTIVFVPWFFFGRLVVFKEGELIPHDIFQIIGVIGGFAGFILRFDDATTLAFYVWNGTDFRTLTAPVAAGNRITVVAQHDGFNTELWVDGNLIDSEAGTWVAVYNGDESGRRLGTNFALTAD